MKRQSQEEIRDVLFHFAAEHNLSLIISFHNELRAGLAKRVAEIDESLNGAKTLQERNSLQAQRVRYGEVFQDMLRSTTFLLMYAHAEEWFYLVWKTYARACALQDGVGSIKRFRSVLKDGLGVDLSKDKNWQFLCDAEDIRDCLLHANGRVSMMMNPNRIRQIVRKRGLILERASGRLQIPGDFLNEFKDAIDAVITATGIRQ